MRAFVSVMIWCLTVVAAQAVPLSIVEVSAPEINCKFDTDCRVVVHDTTDHFVLPLARGDAFLQSRRFPPGEVGTVAAGLYAYLYRLDLRKLVGLTALPCLHTLSFDFGPITSLDYDDNKKLDQVFVITKGGVGSVAPAEAEQVGDTVTFSFKPSVCAGSFAGGGDSTFFFGLVSTEPPTSAVARVWDILGTETVLDVQVPLQEVDVDCDAGDSLAEALRKVKSGDTLRVTGTCKEEVSVPVDGITLLGVGRAEIAGLSGKEATVTIAGRRQVVLKNLLVSNGFPGVFVQGSTGIVFEAVQAVQNTGEGFQFEKASTAQLTDCVASRNEKNGISARDRSRLTFFGDNLSSYNKVHGIKIFDHADAIVGEGRAARHPKRALSSLPVVRGGNLQSPDPVEHTAAAATAAKCTIQVVGNTNHGVLVSGGSYFSVGPGCTFLSRKNGKDGIRFTGVSSGDFLDAQATINKNAGCGMNVRDTSSVAVDGSTVKTVTNGADGIKVEDTSEIGIDVYGGSTINSRLCSKNNTQVGLAVLDLSFVSCGGGVAMTLHPNVGADADVSADSTLTCAVTIVDACSNTPPPPPQR